jgi:hypothetical protein
MKAVRADKRENASERNVIAMQRTANVAAAAPSKPSQKANAITEAAPNKPKKKANAIAAVEIKRTI